MLIVKNCLQFYTSDEEEIKHLCFWNLSYLSENEDIPIVEEIIKSDFMKEICEDYVVDSNTVWCVIRIIGNIAGNEDIYVEFLIQRNIFNLFKKLINIDNFATLKETLWAFSNLTATCRNACIKFLEDEDLVLLIKKILFFNNYDVREEVLFFLGNIIENADYLITRKFFDYKIDESLLELLNESKNPELITMLLNLFLKIINLPFFKKKENCENFLFIF